MRTKFVSICTILLFSMACFGDGDYLDQAALSKADLVKYWQLRLPLDEGSAINVAYLVDDQIYLGTDDGVVYAVHAPTGALRWRKQITTAGYNLRKPCHTKDRVIFTTPPRIEQRDRYTGDPIMSFETRFPTASAAISDGVRYYVGGIDNKLYAFQLDLDFEQWKTRTSGPVVSQPQLFDKHLYFASDNGNVYACTASNKGFYWRTWIRGSVTADIVVDKNGVYVANRGDYSLYLLDPAEGGRRWRVRFAGPLTEPPVVTEETAFQYCATDGVFAINTGTVGVEQRVRWKLPQARQLLTVDKRFAYLLSRDENLLVVTLDQGKLIETIPAAGFTLPLPSPGNETVFMAARDGRIFCARKIGTPPLLATDVRQAMKPPTAKDDQTQEAQPESAKASTEENPLKSKQPGAALGGKSKVSKEYTGD